MHDYCLCCAYYVPYKNKNDKNCTKLLNVKDAYSKAYLNQSG